METIRQGADMAISHGKVTDRGRALAESNSAFHPQNLTVPSMPHPWLTLGLCTLPQKLLDWVFYLLVLGFFWIKKDRGITGAFNE